MRPLLIEAKGKNCSSLDYKEPSFTFSYTPAKCVCNQHVCCTHQRFIHIFTNPDSISRPNNNCIHFIFLDLYFVYAKGYVDIYFI